MAPGDEKNCGTCSMRKWRPGTCKSWCDFLGRSLTDEEWAAGCKYHDDWKEKATETSS